MKTGAKIEKTSSSGFNVQSSGFSVSTLSFKFPGFCVSISFFSSKFPTVQRLVVKLGELVEREMGGNGIIP